jgi:micrococcal nuclease
MGEWRIRGVRPWAAVLVAGAVVAASGCGSSPPEHGGAAVVVEVIDGDTVVLDVDGREESVRLIGVDTPETRHPERPVECFGPEATEFTEHLLPPGTAVRLERDIENRDDYGRLLGYVFRASDDVFVNYELVRNGYAVPLSIEPNVTHASLFVEAARSAEADDTGLWATCAE